MIANSWISDQNWHLHPPTAVHSPRAEREVAHHTAQRRFLCRTGRPQHNQPATTKYGVPLLKQPKKRQKCGHHQISETKSLTIHAVWHDRGSPWGPNQIPQRRPTMHRLIMMSTAFTDPHPFNHRPFVKFTALRLHRLRPNTDAHVSLTPNIGVQLLLVQAGRPLFPLSPGTLVRSAWFLSLHHYVHYSAILVVAVSSTVRLQALRTLWFLFNVIFQTCRPARRPGPARGQKGYPANDFDRRASVD